MNKFLFLGFLMFLFVSCSDDDDIVRDEINFDFPSTYTFERADATTVAFGGQTTRLTMGGIINSEFKNTANTKKDLLNLFRNENNPPLYSELDNTKTLSGKTAASSGTPNTFVIADLEGYINSQVDDVFPKWDDPASQGNPGKIADGSNTRYINGKGLEYDQAFTKAMIGALALDQVINNYTTVAVLDAGSNKTDNDNGILVSGKNYTNMEHKWDRAFGYVYGLEEDITAPKLNKDQYLNKYLKSVNDDSDFAGIANNVYKAFIVGRAAIVAKDYAERDKQADILEKELSKIIAIRAIHYLKNGENEFGLGNLGTAFHQLSEGYGFIYSLQFTRNPSNNLPYFTRKEVLDMLDEIYGDLPNGFYDLQFDDEILDGVAQDIASKFGLSVGTAINF